MVLNGILIKNNETDTCVIKHFVPNKWREPNKSIGISTYYDIHPDSFDKTILLQNGENVQFEIILDDIMIHREIYPRVTGGMITKKYAKLL